MNVKKVVWYCILVIVVLVSSRIPHVLGRNFLLPEENVSELFYLTQYALDCVLLFAAIGIVIGLTIRFWVPKDK